MKKIILVLICAAVISPVFSQMNNRNTETDMYYINVPVEKIYSTNLGYIIMYRRGNNQIGTTSVPHEWFMDSAGRAEIMQLPRGNGWPTMSVFFKGGEFSHVRIYVHRNRSHRTWGLVRAGTDIRPFFEDTENFNIEF